jgi:hypothetical protein
MDSALVAQILFANEKAFEGIGDTKECQKLCRVCKAAKENQHILDGISRNRAELYAVRIFNCLLKKSKSISREEKEVIKDASRKMVNAVDIMFNKETVLFRSCFTEHILLDYVELLNHKVRYENGFEINYYNAELFHPYILYNYMSIIKIMGIDFEKELISLKSRKMEETKNNYKYVMYKLWNIEDILKIHNATDCGC